VAAVLAACAVGSRRDTEGIAASWTLDPAPPGVGHPTVTRITLRDSTDAPIVGAKLRLEGHMSHPGMTPVITDVVERAAGEYEAQLQFSMAGDWILVLSGETQDGVRLTKQLDVVGVRPAE
jgi:hypothetical protein